MYYVFIILNSQHELVHKIELEIAQSHSQSLLTSYGACSMKTKALERSPIIRWSWLVIWNAIQYNKSAIYGLLEPVLSRALRFHQACAIRSWKALGTRLEIAYKMVHPLPPPLPYHAHPLTSTRTFALFQSLDYTCKITSLTSMSCVMYYPDNYQSVPLTPLPPCSLLLHPTPERIIPTSSQTACLPRSWRQKNRKLSETYKL